MYEDPDEEDKEFKTNKNMVGVDKNIDQQHEQIEKPISHATSDNISIKHSDTSISTSNTVITFIYHAGMYISIKINLKLLFFLDHAHI